MTETHKARHEAFLERKREEAEAVLPDNPAFEDYLTPVGEYGVPAYTAFPEVTERVVERRSAWLVAAHSSLNERMAVTIAAAEADLGVPWTAEKLGVTPKTVENYYEQIEDALGYGILAAGPVLDIERPLDVDVPDYGACPECGERKVVSLTNVERAFPGRSRDLNDAITAAKRSGASHVCSGCTSTITIGAPERAPDDTHELPARYQNVPERLRESDRWIVWRHVERETGTAKLPFKPGPVEAGPVDAMNPYVHTTFEEAARWADMVPGYGLGYVFGADDGFVGIDLDEVVVDGELVPWATALIERCDSYAEWSPSDTGAHIILGGVKPEGTRNKDPERGFEMYDRKRWFTVTGKAIGEREVRDDQDLIDALAVEYLPEKTPGEDFEFSGGSEDVETASPLYDLTVSDLYPELPVGENVAHPEHGSKTGTNFKVRADGVTAICWHGGHALGAGDGCGLSAVHLLAMQATGETECDEIRRRWKEDDSLVFETWRYAIEERGLPPNPAPYRAIRHVASDLDLDLDAEDPADRKWAWDLVLMAIRSKYGIDVQRD